MARFLKKLKNTKCVFISCKNLVGNVIYCEDKWERFDQKCLVVLVYSTSCSCVQYRLFLCSRSGDLRTWQTKFYPPVQSLPTDLPCVYRLREKIDCIQLCLNVEDRWLSLLTISCRLSSADCQLLSVRCWLSSAVCQLRTVICWLSSADCHLLAFSCSTPIVTSYSSK
jgi:hypothetical protein